jgi:hypothetical protein
LFTLRVVRVVLTALLELVVQLTRGTVALVEAPVLLILHQAQAAPASSS